SRCFSFIRSWVEKKIRRHLARACQRQGFGWKRWSREWIYETLGLFLRIPSVLFQSIFRKRSHWIGLITLDPKCAGARSAGNPHARCEGGGAGNEPRKLLTGHEGGNAGYSQGVSYGPVAPALDPTSGTICHFSGAADTCTDLGDDRPPHKSEVNCTCPSHDPCG